MTTMSASKQYYKSSITIASVSMGISFLFLLAAYYVKLNAIHMGYDAVNHSDKLAEALAFFTTGAILSLSMFVAGCFVFVLAFIEYRLYKKMCKSLVKKENAA